MASASLLLSELLLLYFSSYGHFSSYVQYTINKVGGRRWLKYYRCFYHLLYTAVTPEIAAIQYKRQGASLCLHGVQRYGEVAAKFLNEVHRDTRMNTTLPVE
jgi:hypothetical protein